MPDPRDDENVRLDGEPSDYYQSSDKTSGESNFSDDEDTSCMRYYTNLGEFEFMTYGDNIVLRPRQLFVDVL